MTWDRLRCNRVDLHLLASINNFQFLMIELETHYKTSCQNSNLLITLYEHGSHCLYISIFPIYYTSTMALFFHYKNNAYTFHYSLWTISIELRQIIGFCLRLITTIIILPVWSWSCYDIKITSTSHKFLLIQPCLSLPKYGFNFQLSTQLLGGQADKGAHQRNETGSPKSYNIILLTFRSGVLNILFAG